MNVRQIALLLITAQLVACKLDRENPTPDPASGVTPSADSPFVHFEGVWQGTITPEDTMTSLPAIVIVNGWGEFRLLTDGVQFVGWPRRTVSELEGSLKGIRSPDSTWSDGTVVSSFTIYGSIEADNFIDATYAGNASSGSVALDWVSVTNSTDIDAIQGTWMLLDAHQNYVATFEFDVIDIAEATITGAHSNGCTYSGAAESWTSFNSYDIWEIDVSNCPAVAGVDVNGRYSGTAALIDVVDDGTGELALVLGLSNSETQLTHYLYRL